MTPTLLTPWHDLDRLARAAIDAPKASAAEWDRRPNGELYEVAALQAKMARWEFDEYATPERILSLLDAAARGAEPVGERLRLTPDVLGNVEAEDAELYFGPQTEARLRAENARLWQIIREMERANYAAANSLDVAELDAMCANLAMENAELRAARAVPPALDGPAEAVSEQDQG